MSANLAARLHSFTSPFTGAAWHNPMVMHTRRGSHTLIRFVESSAMPHQQQQLSRNASPSSGIRNVLVSMDFSENAKLSLRWAIKLIGSQQGRIVLVHAVDSHAVSPKAT